MFEPIHGSAPKYTGKRVVNPIATIEAVRMMLEHVGEVEAANHVQDAIATTLGAGEVKTRDMGGSATTDEMGAAVVTTMRANA